MNKEDITKNIYQRWYEVIQNKGRGSNLKPIRSLEVFTLEEIHELIWLLHERLKSVDRSKS